MQPPIDGESGHYFKPPPRNHDIFKNPMMTAIDATGIHYIRGLFCRCADAEEHYMQLLQADLYPVTQKSPQTVFTFNALEDFRIENLECKTASNGYFSKLRRLTSLAFPDDVAVRRDICQPDLF